MSLSKDGAEFVDAIRRLAKDRGRRLKVLSSTGDRIRLEIESKAYMVFLPGSELELTPGRIAQRISKWPTIGQRPFSGHVILAKLTDVSATVLRDRESSLPPNVAVVARWKTRDRLIVSELDDGMALILEAAGIRRAELRRIFDAQQAREDARDEASSVSNQVAEPNTQAPWSRSPRRGMQLDAYQLEHRLGRGHSAEVWRARVSRQVPGVNLSVGQTVAIKVYLPPLLHGFESLRIQREFAVAAEMEHANLARVFDLVISPSRPFHAFMAMEFIDGPTLKQFIGERGRLSALLTCKVALQLFNALAELHSLGAVHRDVKAANVMVARETPEELEIKLVDLGIVAVASDERMTVASVFMGSKHSSPLEQLTGEELDERTDIYGAGSVLYHCLEGKPMYDGAGPEGAIVRQMLMRPQMLPLGGDDFEQRVRHFVNQCIQVDPHSRPRSSVECASFIEKLLPPSMPEAQLKRQQVAAAKRPG